MHNKVNWLLGVSNQDEINQLGQVRVFVQSSDGQPPEKGSKI
jgi:hypothetical protein